MRGQRMPQRPSGSIPMRRFKKGGKVKETGPAVVHKGEYVVPAKQAKKPAVKKAITKATRKKK